MLDLSTLNPAQLEAVTAPDGPTLVIAGAGSGKTRTIVYRLAWLTERGVMPESMLLLTFTRKASQEMLLRASHLLGQQVGGVVGGTFHGFAYAALRRFPPAWARNGVTVMDASDSASVLQNRKEALKIGKGERSFPKSQTVLGIISKARNKEIGIEEVLRREAQHLLPHADALESLAEACAAYRREHCLLDYDDLLFELESLFQERPDVLDFERRRFRHVLVDEYQDTNRVQARLVRLIAGGEPEPGRGVMAVGDDAQSIYAFRGATVNNILDFPQLFPGTRIVRLEENYRSVQPVLDIANAILDNAPEGYRKRLFSRRGSPELPPVTLCHPLSDRSQGQMVASRIEELLDTRQPEEIAVLFRAGYQSYHLEVELNKRGIRFKKFGGLRYTEASHVKDVLSFARLLVNPLDLPAFERMAALTKGVGPKTALKIHAQLGDAKALQKACAKYPELHADLALLHELRQNPQARPAAVIESLVEHYRPRLENLYPDDWPRRLQGLEELTQIALGYDSLNAFLGDLSLESPEEDARDEENRRVTLSTVHSAKGLEWEAVLVLDLVEDRFPSRHALTRPEDYEEERRLLYVACTRAKDSLDLFVPMSIYSRSTGGQEMATPSPFIRELPSGLFRDVREAVPGYSSAPLIAPAPRFAPAPRPRRNPLDPDDAYLSDLHDNPDQEEAPTSSGPKARPETLGYCTHKIFGRGKIVEALPPDKVRVNFPGLGLKVIMSAYLSME